MAGVAIVIVAVISAFVVVIGAVGLVSAEGMRRFAVLWRSERGLWAAAVFRLVFGAALWLAAPSSRTPLVLQALGGFLLWSVVT